MNIRRRKSTLGDQPLRRGAPWALALSLLILVFSSAPAVAVDAPFNLQAAINACPVGGTVSIPAGTLTLTSEVALRSGVSLQGAGVDKTILTMPAKSSHTNLLRGAGISNAAVRDLTIRCSAPTDKILGIHLWDCSRVTLERVKTEGCTFGIKADTKGSDLTVRDYTSRGDDLPLYVSHLIGGFFERLDIANSLSVGIYAASHNEHLRFDGVKILDAGKTTGGKWGIQLWYDYGGASSDIELADFDIIGDGGLVIGDGYSNVRVFGLKATATDDECVRLAEAQDVLIEDFSCSGGPYLLGTYDRMSVPAQRVTLRNGTYAGNVLVYPRAAITGLLIENVSSGSATTSTTKAPTTTTTQVPPVVTTTTTAYVPPVTTTTTRPSTTTTTRALRTTTTTAPTTSTTKAPTTTTQTSTTTTVSTPKSTTTTVATDPRPAVPYRSPIAEPEAVTISTPVDGSVVTGAVKVSLALAPELEVGKVRFSVDNRWITQDYRAPYTFTWNTSWAPSGTSHTITGVVYDKRGREIGRASSRVTVDRAASRLRANMVASATTVDHYPDLNPDSSHYSAVCGLSEAGVISGFTDGRVGAERVTTRAQFAKMASVALGIGDVETDLTPFADLGSPDERLYPHKYVAALHDLGAIVGTSPTEFSPWSCLTRAQVVTILIRALETLEPNTLVVPANGLSALGDFSADHARSMAIAEASGLLNGIAGYGPGWNPWAPADRGEVAQILCNLTGGG